MSIHHCLTQVVVFSADDAVKRRQILGLFDVLQTHIDEDGDCKVKAEELLNNGPYLPRISNF